MSRRIFRDIEEAISREVRRITHHDSRTLDRVVLRDTYDPFTGEIVTVPVEPRYYDSSADAHNVGYPHFFIRLLKTREDKTTGRVVPEYGKWIQSPVQTSPKAYEIIISGSDGFINVVGNTLTTSIFQIRKVLPGQLIRILSGNNKGTYIVDTVVVDALGNHEITVSNTLTLPLPVALFDTLTRKLTFQGPVDLNTIKVGDIFEDASSTIFSITAVDAENGSILLGGTGSPDLTAGSTISRIGNVFTSTDLTAVRFMVLDPTKPVKISTSCGEVDGTTQYEGFSPEIPLDAFYLIRIDSKSRDTHIDVLNRVWEEFNPPRTALPVVKRTALSAEQSLVVNLPVGGSTFFPVKDASNFSVGDKINIIDDLTPTKRQDGEGFQRPFESKIKTVNLSTNIIELEDLVPDTFTIANCARIVSNAEFRLFMFHFVDHVTKDVEGSQYWVHEFTFWVQLFVDRLEDPEKSGVVQDISTPLENLDDGNVISEDP